MHIPVGGLVQVTVSVPRAAASAFVELASVFCDCMAESENVEWKISHPLPEKTRVGKLLRAARLRADLTQEKLAKMINVPQAHISQYERNKRKIPPMKAKQLAKTLHTSEEYFLLCD